MKISMKSNDQAVSISVEFILIFTITVFLFLMVFNALGGYLTGSNELIMKERFKDIGNEISNKMVNIYKIGGNNGSAYTWVKLPDDINGRPFDVKIVGNGSDSSNPLRIVVAAQRLNAETYVTVNELSENVRVESNILTSGNTYTIIYENLNIYFYQGLFDLNKPPFPYITYPLNNTFVSGNLTVQVSSDPDTSKINFQNWSIINGTWTSFGNDTNKYDGWSYPYNTSDLSDGTYILFRVNAIDRLGKNGTSPIVNVTVDNTPPDIIPLSPDNNTTVNTRRPIISANYSDNVSGINIASVKMQLNGVDQPITPNAPNVSYKPKYNLTDGWYNVSVIVSDNAGNINSTNWGFKVEPIKKHLNVTGGYDSSTGILKPLNIANLSSNDDGLYEIYLAPGGAYIESRNQTYYFANSSLNYSDIIKSVNITFDEYNEKNNIYASLYLFNNITGELLNYTIFERMKQAGNYTWEWDVSSNVISKDILDNLQMKFLAYRTGSESIVRVDWVDVAYEYYLE